MRVTNQTTANNLLANLSSLRSRLDAIQQQVSSGKRINFVSEDPSAGGDVMRVQSRLLALSQWEKNVVDARSWANETETALAHMTDLMSRAREIAVRGANSGPLSDQDRQTLAIEVDAILADLLATLNRKQLDGALFGGYTNNIDPFSIDMTTGAVTYAGDSGTMMRDVGPGITVEANLHGNRLGDWTQPDNILTAVWQLSQDLKTPNSAGMRAAMNTNLARLDQVLRSTLSLRAEMGSREKRLDQLEIQNWDTLISLQQLLEQAQGADMEKAITDLNTVETTYRAALQAGARIIPPTLADFLR